MRVLMLGWDFSPRLSGGVGSACQGLANALARAPAPLHTDVLFVLPRVRGDEEPESVRLLAGDEVRPSGAEELPAAAAALAPVRARVAPARARALVAAASEEGRAAAVGPAPTQAAPIQAAPIHPPPIQAEPAPVLPAPAEALHLLAIDSPLRPYLSPEVYAGLVRALLAGIRRAPSPSSSSAPAPAPAPSRPEPAVEARVRAPRPTSGGERGIARASGAAATRVPPWGSTLVGEVERYARATLALVQHEGFDVIHAHDWMTFPAGILLRERTGKPLVVHFHSCESERRGLESASDVHAIEQAGIAAAERVLCVSEASARTLREHYAVEYAKVRVLHNAFAPLASDVPRAERAAPVVLFLGRLSEQKAPDVFLRAAARVHAHSPAVRFVLAGAGELYPELVALAQELDLAEAVRFTGFVAGEELARTYAGADVYVLSSAAEPFGISALEALSLGVPTIVPHGAGVGEVVRSVLRFEPGDELDLADKIVALLERPVLRKQLAATGLREVKKIRWDRPARALRGIYDELVVATS